MRFRGASSRSAKYRQPAGGSGWALVFAACQAPLSNAWAQEQAQPEEPSRPELPGASPIERDSFDLAVRTSSNVQIFRRALLPGPGGAIVEEETLAPLHQSLSMRASRLDSPIEKDGVEIQIATWGMLVLGSPEEMQTATWDVSSAFIRQRYRGLSVTIGRQPVVGGAARYSRLDGAVVSGELAGNFRLETYGGLTVLPRWNRWYGVHHLGDGYDDWTRPDMKRPEGLRGDNWMAGGRSQWNDPKVGSLGFSFHYQAENGTFAQKNLGLNGAVTALDNWDFRADAIVSADAMRFSDARATITWDALRKGNTSLIVTGRLLHTVPSLLLSQASVFSVFSHEEITEAGGQLEARLGSGLRLNGSGYVQALQEGTPGHRLGAGIRFDTRDERFTIRLRGQRVRSTENGYWMARFAASYAFVDDWTLLLDTYQYVYDESIRDFSTSSFYATHLRYEASIWDMRVGGSLTSSPYAELDAQALGRFTLHWDRSR